MKIKILTISLFFLILGIFILPNFVLARKECPPGEGYYSLERPIFGLECAKGPADYISQIYPIGLGLGIFAAAAMIVYAGIVYSVARDDPNKKTESKKKIYAALGGVALILGTILALNIINPDLADPEKWQEGIAIKEVPSLGDVDFTNPCASLEIAARKCYQDCKKKFPTNPCVESIAGAPVGSSWYGICGDQYNAVDNCSQQPGEKEFE